MARTFKFSADFSDLMRGVSLQKTINDSLRTADDILKGNVRERKKGESSLKHNLSLTNGLAKAMRVVLDVNAQYEAQNRKINEVLAERKKVFKQLDNEGASPLRKKLVGMRFSLKQFGTGLKNPFPLLVKGAGMLKVALLAIGKAAGIGLLIAAVMIFKRMWDANIGGIQRTFFQVVGQLQKIWGGLMAKFYDFVEKVGPMLAPIFDMWLKAVQPFIDEMGELLNQFFDGGAAVGLFASVLLPVLNSAVEYIKIILPIFMKLIKGIFSVGANGESALGKLLKSFGGLFTAVFKLLGPIFELLDTIGFFDALVFVIGILAEGLNVVVVVVQAIVEWLAILVESLGKAINGFKQLIGLKNKDAKVTEEQKAAEVRRVDAVQRTLATQAAAQQRVTNTRQTVINNSPVVNVNSAAPITPETAPQVGDMLARSVSVNRRVI